MRQASGPARWFQRAAVAAAASGLLVACDAPAPDESDLPHSDPAVWAKDVSPTEEGIALGIVFDTSGSMADQVRNSGGEFEPKYQIARRALDQILDRLAKFQASPAPAAPGTPRRLDVGVWIFEEKQVAELAPMAPFNVKAIRHRLDQLKKPTAGTPLGRGVEKAGDAVLSSKLTRRHVLVVTDGINTNGPDPARVWPGIGERAKVHGSSVSVHFMAFDVDAKVFDPVKRLGATVVAAADERTLGEQLGYILDRKILLEEEEPPKPRDVKQGK